MASRRTWLALLVVLGVTALVFARTLSFEFVDYDDAPNLLEHEAWRGLSGEHLRWMLTASHMGHWHPLTWLSWAVDHERFGMNPLGYHLQNVLWHLVCAALAFFVIRRLVKDELAAAAGALFFAIHPLRVESVAWITERRDVLSGAFWLATILCYLRAQDGRRWPWLAAAFFCCALSLLAKAWAITLPAVLLVLDVWPLRRSLFDVRVWLEKLPFCALAAFAADQALRAQAASGAMRSLAELPWLARFGQACFGLVFYPWLTLFPSGLVPSYEMTNDTRVTYTRYALGLTFVLASATGLWLARRRAPYVVAAAAIYAITVSPVLGAAQSGLQIAADRYSYLSCLPFAALFALGVRELARLRPPTPWRWLAAVWLAILAGITIEQCGFWTDSDTLWTRTVERAPEHATANYNLAHRVHERAKAIGEPKDARAMQEMVALYQRAEHGYRHTLALMPDHAAALNNLGVVLSVLRRPAEAIPLWEKCARLWAHDVHGQEAMRNLMIVRQRHPELFK